jgi:membrane fusion protein (multidrug efflux system)
VDDFQRVKKGEVLVEIEDDDYRARVAQAEADLQAAKAEARSIEAEAMSRRWKLQRAVENLDTKSPSYMLASPLSIRTRRR